LYGEYFPDLYDVDLIGSPAVCKSQGVLPKLNKCLRHCNLNIAVCQELAQKFTLAQKEFQNNLSSKYRK
jgi:hypothetical protein